MGFDIYVNGCCVNKNAIIGCECVGDAWVKAQKLAETLNTSCYLVSAETGEIIALWEP